MTHDNDYYEVAGGYVAEGMNAWLGLAMEPNQTTKSFGPVIDGEVSDTSIRYDLSDTWRDQGLR